jgi:hypothetical protein
MARVCEYRAVGSGFVVLGRVSDPHSRYGRRNNAPERLGWVFFESLNVFHFED